jgi:SAM-dependent methyltransferase
MRSTTCEEGCGCVVADDRAFVVSVDGVEHTFCCRDCAETYQDALDTGASRLLRKEVAPGQTVVDLGCGSGYYVVRLADAVGAGGKVWAAEPSPGRLAQARAHWERAARARAPCEVRFVDGSASVPDGCADFVLSNNVLCCTADRKAAVRELGRVLRPGGRAYVRAGDMSVPGVPPIDAGDWAAIFEGWTVQGEGGSGPVRWALLSKPGRRDRVRTRRARPSRSTPRTRRSVRSEETGPGGNRGARRPPGVPTPRSGQSRTRRAASGRIRGGHADDRGRRSYPRFRRGRRP